MVEITELGGGQPARGCRPADAALDLGPNARPHSRRRCAAHARSPSRTRVVVVGVLSCYSSTPSSFTEDHLRLLELAAASLASAIASVASGEAGAPPLAVNAQRRIAGSTVLSIVKK